MHCAALRQVFICRKLDVYVVRWQASYVCVCGNDWKSASKYAGVGRSAQIQIDRVDPQIPSRYPVTTLDLALAP